MRQWFFFLDSLATLLAIIRFATTIHVKPLTTCIYDGCTIVSCCLSRDRVELESEDRRALVLLGVTAIFASFLAAMWAAVWTNIKKPEDFFFNFPYSSVPHLTVFLIPLLQTLIYTWLFYAIFVFFYFSVDWFPG